MHESVVTKAFYKITHIKRSADIFGNVVDIGNYHDGSCILPEDSWEAFCFNAATGENIYVFKSSSETNECKLALTSKTPFIGTILSSSQGKVFISKKRRILIKLLEDSDVCGYCPVLSTNTYKRHFILFFILLIQCPF